jgi:hypothetical protein
MTESPRIRKDVDPKLLRAAVEGVRGIADDPNLSVQEMVELMELDPNISEFIGHALVENEEQA